MTGRRKEIQGPCGWAWVIADGGETPVRWEAGALGTATNNVAELTALERLLAATDPGERLEVRMDSQYAMKAVTTWLPGWKRNGWKTSAGKPVANQELVTRIDALLEGRAVEFRYVPAHQVDGDRLNDFADRAASQAAVVQEPAGTDYGSPEPPASPDTVSQARRSGSPSRPRHDPRRPRPARSTPSSPAAASVAGPTRPHEPIAKNPKGWGHPECRTGAGAAE